MERDYPIGHPAASDYAGEPYNPPRAPYGEDFAEDHPARGGKNIAVLDTPDGLRTALAHQQQDLVELAAVGSLPALYDPKNDRAIPLKPEELAHIYAYRMGLLPDPGSAQQAEIALDLVVPYGFSVEDARALIEAYCVPISSR